MHFPIKARAFVALVVKPAIEEIVGYRKYGEPVVRRQQQTVEPGELFEIADERTYRQLVPHGYCELVGDDAEPIEVEE